MSPSAVPRTLSQYHARLEPPIVQLIVAVEIEHGIASLQILESARVAQIAAQADVLREEAHHAAAEIPTEDVVGRADARERCAVNLRAHEAKAAGQERADARAMSAADRNADDQIAHEIDDRVVPEVVLSAPEARAVAEGQLAADDPGAHPSGIDAKRRAPVADATTPVRADPGCDETFRARLDRRTNQRHGRGQNEYLECTSHGACSSAGSECKRRTPTTRGGKLRRVRPLP